MAKARNESAVDRADSSAVSPGANEHEKRVQGNDTVRGSHQDGDDCEGRTTLLAVHVTVGREVDNGLSEILTQLAISPVEVACNSDVDVPRVTTELGGTFLITFAAGRIRFPFRLVGSIRIKGCSELVVGRVIIPVLRG